MTRVLHVIGAPSSAGAYAPGQERAPAALREAGVLNRLRSRGITVDDVRWFCRYASRLDERALEQGLRASGADDEEARIFSRALIERIRQLRDACAESGAAERTVRAG